MEYGYRTCPQCGAVNPANSKFCDGCGINLTQQLHTTSKPLGGVPGAAPPVGGMGGAGHAHAPSPTPAQTYAPGARLLPGQTLAEHMVIGDGGRYVIDTAARQGRHGQHLPGARHPRQQQARGDQADAAQLHHRGGADRGRAVVPGGDEDARRDAPTPTSPISPTTSREAGFHFIVQEYVTGEDLQKKLDAAGGKGLPEKQVLGWGSARCSRRAGLPGEPGSADHPPRYQARQHRGGWPATGCGWWISAWPRTSSAPRRSPVCPPPPLPAGSRSRHAMGTPGYAPREQFLGQETPLSDLYALGATMHQLLTGRNPQGVTEPLVQLPADPPAEPLRLRAHRRGSSPRRCRTTSPSATRRPPR